MAERLDAGTQFFDETTGALLVAASIHIGKVGLDPTILANQTPIFSDRALSVVLANPQLTGTDGRSVNKIWIPGQYSIVVENSSGTQKFQDLDSGETAGAETINLSNVLGINTITAEGSPTITTLTDQALYILQITNENTADAVTLNIDTIGAKAVKRNFDIDVGKGKLKVGQTFIVAYNLGNDNFEWVNENARVIFQTKGADIASAATVDLSVATGNLVDITGSTGPITSFGTVLVGVKFSLKFDSTPTITHSANILCPAGLDLVMRVNDVIDLTSDGAGIFSVREVHRFNGGARIVATAADVSTGTNDFLPVTPLQLQTRVGSGGILQADIGAAQVGQGELKTSTGDLSTAVTDALFTGPGGEYGFWPRILHTGGRCANCHSSAVNWFCDAWS